MVAVGGLHVGRIATLLEGRSRGLRGPVVGVLGLHLKTKLLLVHHLDARICLRWDVHAALCSVCQKMLKIAAFGRKIRKGEEIDTRREVWFIGIRSWISAELGSVLQSASSTTSTTATTTTIGSSIGYTTSCFAASASCRLLGFGVLGLYLMGHVVSILLPLHSRHHVHLVHLRCSRLGIHHCRASGTHCRRSLIHLLSTALISRLHTTTPLVGRSAVRVVWRSIGHLLLVLVVASTTATGIWSLARSSRQSSIPHVAVNRLCGTSTHVVLLSAKLQV